jgi:hypothetical protein
MPADFEFAVSLNADEPLSVGFIAATLRDLEAMLRDIERSVSDNKQSAADWKWAEDAELTFVAHVNGVDEHTLSRVVGSAQSGFINASRAAAGDPIGIEWPAEFGTEARQSAERILRRLAELESITIEATGFDPVVIREARIDQLVVGRSHRRVFSSVDGILELIAHPRRGRTVRAGLRESSSGRYVRCSLAAEKWRDELRERNLWDRLVRLYGRVAYDDEGVPLSIVDVTDIVDRQSGVRLKDFRGAAPDLSNGASPDEFVDRLRGSG